MVPTHRVATLLFFSGLSALVYQTAWSRLFRLLFGASTAATAATLAVFMGGLGVGGWLLGRRVERHPAPLMLYGNLELMVSVLAAASVGFLQVANALYSGTGGSQAMGPWLATLIRFVLAVMVMGPCAVLMGATLPAASRAVTRSSDAGRAGVATLLGANTLGAVTGVVLTTFLLVEVLGTVNTLYCAALLNALVGLLARSWSRDEQPTVEEDEVSAAADVEEVAPGGRASLPFVLGAAAAVGFAFMLMELVWYRMLGPILGGSTYTFGLVLAVALAGLGLGGAAYAAAGSRVPVTMTALAVTCAAEALAVMIPWALGDRVALLAAWTRPMGVLGFPWLVCSWFLVSCIVVLPAAAVAGFQFPLLIALMGRGREGVGRDVGLAYAANTLGSIVGSLAGGFGLLPTLGALGAWRTSAGVLLVVSLVGLVLAWRAGVRSAWPLALTALALLAFLPEGPTAVWRHSGVGAGRSKLELATGWNAVVDRMRTIRRGLVREFEGIESGVALVQAQGYAFIVNGKSDGNSLGDAGTQIMGGMLAAAMVDAPGRALVVGLGTGSTAGWLARLPTMQRVDVAEIEPRIVDVSRACSDVNEHVLENPVIRVHIEDARELLLTSRERYDIIFSEPSNPYRAGIASLYTREFYEAARSRLNDGGVLLQWLQAYEVDGETVRTVLVTLGAVFPYVEIWRTQAGDLVLRASGVPPPKGADALRSLLAADPVDRALRVAWSTSGLEGFLARFVAGDVLVRALVERYPGAVNTDDVNFVEFAFARSVGRSSGFSIDSLRDLALELGADRPGWIAGEVDWRAVALERARLGGRDRPGIAEPEALEQAARLANPTRVQEAVRHWRTSLVPPKGIAQSIALATGLAQAGDEAALDVARLAGDGLEAEQAVIRARLRVAQGRTPEAVDAMIDAIAALRRQTWIAGGAQFTATLAAVSGALRAEDAELLKRLDAALAQPFPSAFEEQARRGARQQLSMAGPGTPGCATAFEVDEPHTPWNRLYLLRRAACYERVGSPRAEVARQELAQFLGSETTPLFDVTPDGPPTQREANAGLPGER